MNKATLSLAALAGTMLLASCGSTGSSVLGNVGSAIIGNAVSGTTSSSASSSSTASSTTGVLGNLLGTLLSNSTTLSQSDLVGTWNYTGASCVFESENLLAKAGGAVAASKVESQLNSQFSKFGIKQGACSYTFNKDNTYTATIGGRTISGNYTLDAKNKTVKLTYLAGIGSMTAHVAKTGNTLNLLVDSSKMLTLLKGVSALSKGSTTLSAITSLLGNYDGMLIGMKMQK